MTVGPLSKKQTEQKTPVPVSRIREILAYAGALAIGLFAALLPYLLNRRFYFYNDEETYCYPTYLEIGRSLRQGHWPRLSLETFCGGNLSINWELALYNPVSLFTYWLMAPTHNLEVTGCGLAGFYIIFLAIGGYRLARSFGLARDLALVVSAVLATNNFVIYFFAGAWITNLISWCWFVWTWAALQNYRKERRGRQLLLFVICAYLTVSSGFPHGLVMLAVLVASYWLEMMIEEKALTRKSLGLISGGIAVTFMAAPMLLPTFLSLAWTSRGLSLFNHGFLTPQFVDLFPLSCLFYLPHMRMYNAPAPYMPLMFLAWFVVPLLPMLDWKTVIRALHGRWALGLFGVASLLFLNGPEQVGPIRYPIRFLPYVDTTLLLGFCLALASPNSLVFSRPRMVLAVVLVLLGFAISVTERPEFLPLHLLGICLSLVLTLVACYLIQAKATHLVPTWLLAGTLCSYLLTHACYTANLELAGPGSNPIISPSLSTPEKPFTGYTLYAGPAPTSSQHGWWREFFFAAQATELGIPSINGYTPIGHRTFSDKISGDNWCTIHQPDAITYLFSTDFATGKPMIDLMRVNTLILDKNSTAPWAQPFLDSVWREAGHGLYSIHFERTNPDLRPTTLSWSSPGVQVETRGAPSGESEQLQVDAGPSGGDLVFARLWWPGYRADLDGHPLAVAPLDDLLVKVTVPPQSRGLLTLSFTPPGFYLAWILAALGLFILGLTLLMNSARQEKQTPP